MNRWDETAFVFMIVGIAIVLSGYWWEGLTVFAGAFAMIGFGEPKS